jgi:DNA (cytosine-5)-methyltransferase 1
VVLLGLSEEVTSGRFELRHSECRASLSDVIGGLPRLRSRVTDDADANWKEASSELLRAASNACEDSAPDIAAHLASLSRHALKRADPGSGGRWMEKTESSDAVSPHLRKWLVDPRMKGIANHEVRGHMKADLVRYAYAAAFASKRGRSPRGAEEFPPALHPEHKNWKSGKFVDRFKVQLPSLPSSTITSHLAKDGHYFIHPDPTQLRSVSVREAARLQTFPDNYFFEGSRGAQFRQVGNAVPPWMARQIAAVVHSCLS